MRLYQNVRGDDIDCSHSWVDIALRCFLLLHVNGSLGTMMYAGKTGIAGVLIDGSAIDKPDALSRADLRAYPTTLTGSINRKALSKVFYLGRNTSSDA